MWFDQDMSDVKDSKGFMERRRKAVITGGDMIGMLAVSRAGHDIGNIYVIIGEEKEYVYLADGRIRGTDRPKKKNKKHIQVIKRSRLDKPEDGFRDLEIKRAIKMYQEEANVKS